MALFMLSLVKKAGELVDCKIHLNGTTQIVSVPIFLAEQCKSCIKGEKRIWFLSSGWIMPMTKEPPETWCLVGNKGPRKMGSEVCLCPKCPVMTPGSCQNLYPKLNKSDPDGTGVCVYVCLCVSMRACVCACTHVLSLPIRIHKKCCRNKIYVQRHLHAKDLSFFAFSLNEKIHWRHMNL